MICILLYVSVMFATQFEADNTSTTLNFNTYTGHPGSDWYFEPSARIGEIGECDNEVPYLTLHNQWHPKPEGDELHILNQMTDENGAIELVIKPVNEAVYLPTQTQGLVGEEACIDVSSTTPDNYNPCPPDGGEGGISEEDNNGESGIFLIGKIIQDYLADAYLDSAIIELETVNEDWSKKVLANTYLLKQDTSSTLQKLKALPGNAETDLFKNTIDEVLAFDNTEYIDSVLARQAAIQELKDGNYVRENTYVESVLSSLFNEEYIRHAKEIAFRSSAKTVLNSSLKSEFRIIPNPAKERIQVDLGQAKTGVITISDLSGKTLIQLPISEASYIPINVNYLASGIYFCSFLDQNSGVLNTLKFVIVK